MAESLSHKFGQIIGDLLELAIEPHLQKFAKQNKLFLDKKGTRLTRKGKKLSWIDSKENIHDLDFVLEREGSNEILGMPVAFIETAWRRYTKHSRNKAQEIQGAILPLAEKYKTSSPFIGVVLAGVFTQGALNQLHSSGFYVLYFSYDTVIKAFRKFGINADFNEQTSEQDFKKKLIVGITYQISRMLLRNYCILIKKKQINFSFLLNNLFPASLNESLFFHFTDKNRFQIP